MVEITADENIPYVNELFSHFGRVHLRPGREISAQDLETTDILLVRSVTQVNAALLARSELGFVGTCTIGVDHLDIDYLESRHISYASAPGCNANAVVQYVVSVLAVLNEIYAGKKVVIVGGGNVGSRVYTVLSDLGFDCLCVDPFLSSASGMRLVGFEEIYQADIICLHTPLTREGKYPTEKMLGQTELERLKAGTLLINAGRGGVIDNVALRQILNNSSSLRVVLDVWEHEPDIDLKLLDKVLIGTPHIAGYSLEGRINGALMVFKALCQYLNIEENLAQRIHRQVHTEAFGENTRLNTGPFLDSVLEAYNPTYDHKALLALKNRLPGAFDQLRKNYPMRREYSYFHCPNMTELESALFHAVGFLP